METYNPIIPNPEMPELSIIDYLMGCKQKINDWETRYFDALKDKYASIINLYEEEG